MFFPPRRLVAFVFLAALSASSALGFFEDSEPNWQEGEVEFPPPPSDRHLHEFFVSAASPNTFLVDTSSLSLGDDRVVRFILVVRTPGGAENVTFEGIRCASGEGRLYAHGRPDGEWVPARRSEWAPLRASGYNMPRAVLAAQHFCDGPAPPRSREHALRGLRHGNSRHSNFQ
jgi:hypothetical protein